MGHITFHLRPNVDLIIEDRGGAGDSGDDRFGPSDRIVVRSHFNQARGLPFESEWLLGNERYFGGKPGSNSELSTVVEIRLALGVTPAQFVEARSIRALADYSNSMAVLETGLRTFFSRPLAGNDLVDVSSFLNNERVGLSFDPIHRSFDRDEVLRGLQQAAARAEDAARRTGLPFNREKILRELRDCFPWITPLPETLRLLDAMERAFAAPEYRNLFREIRNRRVQEFLSDALQTGPGDGLNSAYGHLETLSLLSRMYEAWGIEVESLDEIQNRATGAAFHIMELTQQAGQRVLSQPNPSFEDIRSALEGLERIRDLPLEEFRFPFGEFFGLSPEGLRDHFNRMEFSLIQTGIRIGLEKAESSTVLEGLAPLIAWSETMEPVERYNRILREAGFRDIERILSQTDPSGWLDLNALLNFARRANIYPHELRQRFGNRIVEIARRATMDSFRLELSTQDERLETLNNLADWLALGARGEVREDAIRRLQERTPLARRLIEEKLSETERNFQSLSQSRDNISGWIETTDQALADIRRYAHLGGIRYRLFQNLFGQRIHEIERNLSVLRSDRYRLSAQP